MKDDFVDKLWNIVVNGVVPGLIAICFAALVTMSIVGSKRKLDAEKSSSSSINAISLVAYVKIPDGSVKALELKSSSIENGVVTLESKNGNKYVTSMLNVVIAYETEENENGED